MKFLLLLIMCSFMRYSQGRLRPRLHGPPPTPSGLRSDDDNYGYGDYGDYGYDGIQGGEELVCEGSEFRCTDDSGCVDEMYHCDKIEDCVDVSDEKNCSYFECGDGSHINKRFVCDGVIDCFDGSDEDYNKINCTVVHCMTSSDVSMVFGSHVCDGINDCRDDVISDECNCSFTFVCENKKCLDEDLKCDGNDDCGDGSDEAGCAMFECNNGKSVLRHNACDGVDQCGDSSDECNCTDAFKCDNGRCISGSFVCDGNDDCSDTSDECACADAYKCANKRCIPSHLVHNNIDDCGDNSDEMKTTTTTMQYDVTTNEINKYDVTTNEINKFRCFGGKEIDVTLRCNGDDDCGDVMSSDECGCAGVVHCEVMEDKCVTEEVCYQKCDGEVMRCGGKCLGESRVCDRVQDCGDNRDEANCTYTCLDGKRINLNQVCDGLNQCENNEDECECDSSTFRCSNGNCVKAEEKCTGNDACGDCSSDVMCSKKGIKGTWYTSTSCTGEHDCHVTWSLLCHERTTTSLSPEARGGVTKSDDVSREGDGATIGSNPAFFVLSVLIGRFLLE